MNILNILFYENSNFIDYFQNIFSRSKDTSVIISVEGRNYPVDIHYTLEPVPDYIKASVETAIKIHENDVPGDILIFLTGQEEVEVAASMLK